jgi:hypothetical protein
MAPEQMAAGKVGPRTDLWCLGAVMYQALTGRVPFDGATPLAIADQQRDGPAPMAGIDPGLASLVIACLSYRVERRPLDAGALATSLRGWLDGASLEATTQTLAVAPAVAAAHEPEPAAQPAGRTRGRPRGVALLAGATLLALVLLGGVVASGLVPGVAEAPDPTATPRPTPNWTAALLADYREACGEPLDRDELEGMTRTEAEEDVGERIGECLADADEDDDEGPGRGKDKGKGKGNGNGGGNGDD